MEKYRGELTLCRLAAIAISKHLWQFSAILKNELKSCLDNFQDPEEAALPSVLDTVMNHFVVPKAAKEELMFAVGTMGWEMWNTFFELKRKFINRPPEDSLFALEVGTCVDYVHWTTNGCLNMPETMRSLYYAGILRQSYATMEKLCTYCLEDCINDIFPIISMDGYIDWTSRRVHFRGDVDFEEIMTAYWIGRVGNNIDNAAFHYELPNQFYDDTYSLDENMFMNSFVRKQYYWTVKYFWGSFNENQRRRMIAAICEKIMSNNPNTEKYKELFFAKQGLTRHLLMFFLHQLSNYGHDEMRIRILGSGSMLLELLEWPYDNLFFETLTESLAHHNSIDYGPIMERIFHNISNCKEYQLTDQDVKYHRIFYRIWKMNPQTMKGSIDYQDCLTQLVQSGDVDLLNYILKDRELNNRREEFLKEIVQLYICGEADENFLPKFMVHALGSDEEREWFKHQIALASDDSDEGMDQVNV